MSPERLRDAPAAAEVTEAREWTTFRTQLSGLERSLGARVPLPDNPTDQQLDDLAASTRQRVVMTNFHELNRSNEIYFKRGAIQQAANLEQPAARAQFDRSSYIVNSQAAMYCESLSEVTQFIASSMRNYEQCQDIIATLPPEARTALESKRRQASVVLQALQQACDERVAFANVRQLMRLLQEERRGANRPAEVARLTALRDESLRRLSESSRTVVEVENPTAVQLAAIRTQANVIERTIINIAAGTQRIEGVEDGLLPTTLYLDVLQARYTQIQDQQRALVRDGRHLVEGGGRAMDVLNREREAVMAQMVSYTRDLSGYQMHMAQLTATQRLFGTRVNVEEALQSSGPTNPETRADVNRAALAMRNFHLGRLAAVTNQANIEFGGGLLTRERIRDGLMRSTITAANISSWISRILTANGNVDLGGRVQSFLAGPICEAIGWPKNPDGTLKVTLTDDERNTIIDRLGRLTDTLQVFQRSNNGTQIRDTVSALQALDPSDAVSAERIGQVRDPLPPGEVTAAQIPAKLAELQRTYGNREDAVATLHAILLRQLNGQWGTLNPDGRTGTGFIGQYATMLFSIERMIGVQLDVAGACFQMQKNMYEMAKYLVVSAGVIGLAPLAVAGGGATLAAGIGRRAVGGAWRSVQWLRGTPASATPGPRATPFQRVAYGAALGVEAYRLYETYQEIGQQQERLNDVKGQIAAQLVLAGFVRRGREDVYEHPAGSRIRLGELNQSLDEQRYAAYTRGGVQAIGLGSMLLMGPRVAMGPAGWALIAVQVTIETGITAWEQRAARDLIANPNTPPWLLVALGADRLVNRSEYSMLVNASSWNFLFGSTEATKQAVRDKMYFTIFGQELGSASPELYREIMSGLRNVSEIDGLFNGDFKEVLLPYVYVRLFQKARSRGSSTTWDSVREGRVDRGWVVIPPDVTNLDIREAMREVGVLYVQHQREKRYVTTWRRRAQQQREADAAPADREKQARLADTNHLLRLLGEERVLGQPLRTLTPAFLDAAGDKTRPQLLMEAIYGQVNGNPATPNFRLSAASIATIRGLPDDLTRGGVDLSSGDTMLALGADDEAQLMNLRRIGPLTTDEPAGRVFPEWNDWAGQGRRLLTLPTGIDEAAGVHAARTAANNVSAGANLPQLREDASSEAARDRITEGAVTIFAREGRRFTRDERLAADLYSRDRNVPIVFTHLDARLAGNITRQRALMQNARLPDQGGAFELANVRAVFIESQTLPSGHDVVLFTFVYGDVSSMGVRNSRVYVLQRAAASSATGRSDNQITGRSIGYNENGIRAQRGGGVFLHETLAALQRRELESARLAHETAEREARERPIREARERVQREAAERETLARAERIRTAMERVRATPNTFVSVENQNGNGSRLVMRYRDNGEDKIVSLAPYAVDRGARFRPAPSGVMQEPEHTARMTVDGQEVTIPWNFIHDNNVTWAQARLYLRVLTTAHPGEANMPFERIMDMIPHFDTLRYDVRSNLRTLYEQAADKQGFLYMLILLSGSRGGFSRATVINPLIGENDNVIVRLFRNNVNLFETAGRAGDMDLLSRGLPLMESAPDEFGIWWKQRDPRATALGYRFVFGTGWQWTPHRSGARTWMPVTEETVSAGAYRGQSPTQANLEFIRSLPR